MTEDQTLAELTREVARLEHEIGTQEDVQAIRALQFKYGYYLDKCMMEEAVALYADECELHFMGTVYRGKPGIKRLYVDIIGKMFTGGENGPVDGFMSDYLQMQDIVDVAPDRKTAKGRFRYLLMGANHVTRAFPIPAMPPQWWEAGVYENVYLKEGDIWKIKKLDLHLAFRCDYQTGWRHATAGVTGQKPKLFPENPLGPDGWEDGRAATFPKAFAHPFHYAHPVSGKVWTFNSPLPLGGAEREARGEGLSSRAEPRTNPSPTPLPKGGGNVTALNANLDELAHRAAVLEDVEAIRKVQHTYGYFMDKFLFHEIVDLFSKTGELRFAGQIYRGHAGVARVYVNLIGNLYTQGKCRPVDGVLADHTQLQDIVTVAPDRKTAKGRFRYFMQGASHESRGPALAGMAGSLWEAGLYENEYVRENGVWKIQVLGLNGNYRVDYQTGWRHSGSMMRMAKPVLFPENPNGPDAYVEGHYPTWPLASHVPFHYPHPVTGDTKWSAK